jgi:prefoldin alpha subunit
MSLGGGGGGELEELAQELQQIEAQQEALETQIATLQAEQSAIDDAIEAIEELESGSNVQVPVGGEAYVRAEIVDIDEIVVALGGGYAAERDQEGAIESLEIKRDGLDDRIEDVRSDVAELETEADQLEQRAQQMQQQQMQQMMQQQQQGPDE